MRYAFAYGADAVYAGQPRYSLRVRENEFNRLEVMADAVAEAHRLGKKFYIASNIAPHNSKVRSYMKAMQPVIEMQPDALIMSDPGLIMMVRQRWPDVPIHLSVQANTVNFAAVQFWQSQGLARIILSRELSIPEIMEIQQECPDMELEVFVHGALCIAYSGRCLLSGYINHRDSNQGACTNACRWNYSVTEAEQTAEGVIQPRGAGGSQVATAGSNAPGCNAAADGAPDERLYMIQEEGRPGELMPAFEDEHGTYIMNSRDLRAVEHVDQFVAMGISSLKIEGRTKTHFYAARTAQVYRRAIDDALRGQPLDSAAISNLNSLSNRGYTDGFYSRRPISDLQNYETGNSVSHQQRFVGEVIRREEAELIIDVKNRFAIGDELELMTPARNATFALAKLHDLKGEAIDVAPGSGHVVQMPIPEVLRESMSDHDVEFGLLMASVK